LRSNGGATPRGSTRVANLLRLPRKHAEQRTGFAAYNLRFAEQDNRQNSGH
jgi:hypothetical protein